IERPSGVMVLYRKHNVFAARPGLTVETFETAGGLVTRNVVYWSAEEVAARFRPIQGPDPAAPRSPGLAMLADGDTLRPSGRHHGDGHLPHLRSAAAARAGRADAPPLRALRRLRHVLAGGVRGRDRPGSLPAPRRGDELPQDRRAVRPARHDRVARRAHELLPRELRLRRRGAHRRHR